MSEYTAPPRLRVYVAGAADAPLTYASLVALVRNPGVDLVGLDLERIDPARLRDARPDLLLSAAHQHLIRAPELEVARVGSVGIHPALLPRYRGSHPLWWALHNGEREAGVTLYVLDTGIDTGPILAQERFAIEPGDTFSSLYACAASFVGPMLDELVATVRATGALPPGRVQDESQATLFRAPTYAELHGTLGQRLGRRIGRVAHAFVVSAAGLVESIAHTRGGGE